MDHGMMYRTASLHVLAIMLFLLVQPGQSSAALLENLSLEFEGITRVYDLQVPENTGGEPLALVIDLHGFLVSKATQRQFSQFDKLAEQQGFIAVFPDGWNFAWNTRIGWIRNDDVGFLRALVAKISAEYNVDLERVYATGHSMGGEMVYRLACEAADLFAAFSTIAMVMNGADAENCHPSRAVPILSVNGLTDTVVPYAGTIDYLSAPATRDYWREKNNCQGPLVREELGPQAWCDTDRMCQDGVQAQWCAVTANPGSSSGHLIYRNTAELDLAELSWAFFQSFTLSRGASGFQINAGLNDAWVNADAPFQGLFITVFPAQGLIFLAWFTFDADPLAQNDPAVFGAPDQRWVTALGSYAGNRAELTAELTTGGRFNASQPVPTQDTGFGSITIEFSDCTRGSLTYDFPGTGQTGSFAINRALNSNVPLCESLAME